MKTRLPLVAALLGSLFSTTATAPAQVGVYAGFSGGHVTAASSTLFGPLFGVYLQRGGPLSIGIDARGTFLTHSGTQFYTGAVGPRVAIVPPLARIRPYLEGLVGVSGVSSGASSSTHLNYQVLFGVDATIVPHIDWRVIEYSYSVLQGASTSATVLTTGIVLQLP